MKTKRIYFWLFLLLAGLLSSCTKEKTFKVSESSGAMLYLKSYQEFEDESDKIKGLDLSSLQEWEKTHHFKSFGVRCDEIFAQIDFEKISTIEEIKEIVRQNEKYLQLIEDQNGEFTVETQMHNNPKRYFISEDKLFRVGDLVYKVFEEGQVATSPENIERLKHISQFSEAFGLNPKEFFVCNNRAFPSKISYGTKKEEFADNTGDRTVFEFFLSKEVWKDGSSEDKWYQLRLNYKVTPKKKSIGWLGCNRTLYMELKVKTHYVGFASDAGRADMSEISRHTDKPARKLEDYTIVSQCPQDGNSDYRNYYFVYSDSKAWSPSAGPVVIAFGNINDIE